MEYELVEQLDNMVEGLFDTIVEYEIGMIPYDVFVSRMRHYTVLVDVLAKEIMDDLPKGEDLQ